MKIEFDNGVTVLIPPTIAEKVKAIVFEDTPVQPADGDPKSKKAKHKKASKVKSAPQKKGGASSVKDRGEFTEEELQNIVELYGRGEPTGSIARLFKVTPAKMYMTIYRLKKQGRITERN